MMRAVSATPPPELLRARTLLPVSRPAIHDGAVVVNGGFIRDAGPFRDVLSRNPDARATDLGDVILMPGLINAHCHLDYTHMAGKIPRPQSFPDWIKSILALKAHWSYSEYAASWLDGARQLLRSGTTTVVDVEAVPELLPDVWRATPLRVFSLMEMTGVRSGGDPERILEEALWHVDRLPKSKGHGAGLSPHAPYSTPPKLLHLIAQAQIKRGLPIAMHVAESIEEWKMYQEAAGPLYEWLKAQRPMTDCGGRSPVQQVHSLGLMDSRFLMIHANYLAPGDAEVIAKTGASVAHCPKSHEYFGHAPFQFDELRKAGVNLCVATDSLASVHAERGKPATLNLWEELLLFARKHPAVSPQELLELITINPARALKIPAGALEAGRWADLIAVESGGLEELVAASPKIIRRMIGGQWLEIV